AIAKYVPSKTEARAQIVVIAFHTIFGHARIATEQDAGGRIFEERGFHASLKVLRGGALNATAHFMPGRRGFVAHPQVQREIRAHFEVILEEERRVGGAIVLVLARPLVKCADAAQEEIGHRTPSHVAIEDKVARAAEFIRNIHAIARNLTTE